MLTREQAGDIFDRVRKLTSADEIEILITGGTLALTRFANNIIHQNVEDQNHVISVRTVFDGRTARASTNKFDDASLRQVVMASEALAKVQHPDPDLLPMPDSREAIGGAGPNPGATERHFTETAAVTPLLRAESVRQIVDIAKNHKLTAAGICSSSESVEGIFNSRGLARWHSQTLAEISISMLGADSSGWQKSNSPNVAGLDPVRMADVAARKAIDSAHPAQLSPGKYTVILEPSAALDIVGFMFWDYSGMAILDQRSFLTGRIGSKLFGSNITIWDDVSHPLQAGSPFDGEGMTRKPVAMVEKGVVKRVVYARTTAARMRSSEFKDTVGPIEATGHGFPLPNEVGEMPLNTVFAAPENPQTLSEMIASTERGILVTRL